MTGINAHSAMPAQTASQLHRAPHTAPKDADQALAEKSSAGPDTKSLGPSEAEQAHTQELRTRDREVRAHENAHASVGGAHAGSPSYTYQVGPDGQRYAIGGEVPIDVSPVEGNPEATIAKMQIVVAAALAPAEPSSADRRIAAMASAQMNRALADLANMEGESQGEGLDLSI